MLHRTLSRALAPLALLCLFACADDNAGRSPAPLPDDAGVALDGAPHDTDAAPHDATPPPPCEGTAPLVVAASLDRTVVRTCAGAPTALTVEFGDARFVELLIVDALDAIDVRADDAPGIFVTQQREGADTTLVLERTEAGPASTRVLFEARAPTVDWTLTARFIEDPGCIDDVGDAPDPIGDDTEVSLRLCPGSSRWLLAVGGRGTFRSHSLRLDRDEGEGTVAVQTAIVPDDLPVAPAPSDAGVESRADTLTVEIAGVGADEVGLFRVENRGAVPATFRAQLRTFDPRPTIDAQASGVVEYVDRPFDASGFLDDTIEPVRYGTVEVVRTDDGAVVATARTEPDGRWSVNFAAREGESFAARALAAVDVRGHRVRVVDRSRARRQYAMQSEPALIDADAPVLVFDLRATRETELGGAFNIADTMGEAAAFIDGWVAADAPLLTVEWEQGMPFACGSCYLRNRISIGGGVEDTDEYDDDILFHEFGHYFVDHYSYDDSRGGPHRDRVVSPALAFGEGLAYWFSAAIRDTAGYVDTFEEGLRWVDIEAVTVEGGSSANLTGTSNGAATGNLREEIVSGLLWDLMDEDDDEAHDRVGYGLDAMMTFLTTVWRARETVDVGAPGADITDVLQHFACTHPDDADAIAALADALDFPWPEPLDADGAPDDAPTPCFKGHAPRLAPPRVDLARRDVVRTVHARGIDLRVRTVGASAR